MQLDGVGAYQKPVGEEASEEEEKGVQEDHSAQARMDAVESGGYRIGQGSRQCMSLVGERQECRSHLCKDLVGTDLVCMGEKWTSCSSSVRKNVMYTLSLSTWQSTLPWLHPFSVFPYVRIETRCFWPWVTSHLFGRAESSRQIRSADICRSMTTSPLTNYASMVSVAV